MKKKILILIVGLFVIIACGGTAPTSAPGVDSMVTQTLQALTAAPAQTSTPEQLTPDGTTVNTAEISFIIPNGVANDAASALNTNVEYPYINPSSGDMPQHITITLDLYAVSGAVYNPQIMVFRAAEYAQYSERTASTISSLQSLQYVDGQPLPEALTADFISQIHAVNFKNGYGVRYLTQVFQNFNPVNNQELFYYYQGITDDGQYFVQATLPINTTYLSADGNPNTPLPADGIPFNMDDFPGYLNAVNQKLNSTETFNFNPYLDALDEMIQSIQIIGF